MKRKIVVCFLVIIMVCTGFACSKEDAKEEPETIETVYEQNITASEDGTYFLFYTNLEQEYVDFLEMMDQEKYVIEDITVQGPSYHAKSYFAVTYRLRETDVEESAN